MIDLPLVSLDLELLDAENGTEIIEIGAVKFRGSETLSTFSSQVRPVGTLSFRIGALTGLTSADLESADDLSDVLPKLSAFIGGAPLVGQSIGLDVEHLRRAGLPLRNPQLDTFELAMLLRPGLRSYDLLTIARDLGVGSELLHRALADAQLARDVFLALARRAADLGLDTLGQIVRLARPLEWPLKLVFSEAQRVRVRQLVGGGSADEVGAGQGILESIQVPDPPEPLSVSAHVEPVDVDAIASSLQVGGSIASRIAQFEERPEQRQMLTAVADAFNQGETLLVEAGTGTGKSLAYLVPALHFAVKNNQRVVVSTNTINLQDQLCDKDVPVLLSATGLPAVTAVLKGRTNYLCLRRWQTLLGADDLSAPERMLLIRTLLWLPGTARGDRAELKLTTGEEEAWIKVAAIAEVCSPRRCPFHREGTCFVARARRAAEGAHLIVVNHSLLLSDIMTGSQVLPEYRYLVIDEAHHLEDEATSQLSRRITERELTRHLEALGAGGSTSGEPAGLLSDIGVFLHALRGSPAADAALQLAERAGRERQTVRLGIQRLFSLLREFFGKRPHRGEGGTIRVRITTAVRSQPAWSEIDIAWGEVGRDVLALQRTLQELTSKVDESGARGDAVEASSGELAAQALFWDEARHHLSRVIAESDPSTVAWMGGGQSDEIGVTTAPLHVAEILRDELFLVKSAVVLTSATLTTNGSFRYIREQLGLRDARELAVGSPFDYESSTLVYVPDDGPDPGSPGYQRAVERIVFDVATQLRGRTLVLFTSHNHLRTTYYALRDPLDAEKIIVLGQRVDGSSRARLLEAFRSGRPCVLLGTSSFWEGVDVVGEALSCVIIARLPFALPTDPIVEARSEQFEEPFSQYSLPQAILRFRQGFGRLIRSRTDRGILVVVDGRIRTRSYGQTFLRSLPQCKIHRGPTASVGHAAREWLERESVVG